MKFLPYLITFSLYLVICVTYVTWDTHRKKELDNQKFYERTKDYFMEDGHIDSDEAIVLSRIKNQD